MRAFIIASLFLVHLGPFLTTHFNGLAWAASTEVVSIASNGWKSNGDSEWSSISADGRYVAFASDATNLVEDDNNYDIDIFVHDRQTGETTRVSVASDGTEANDNSENPAISADGQHVAFQSRASNLVAGDSNGVIDIFVHDRQSGTTTRVSVASDGSQANGHSYYPSISADGALVAFESDASNLVLGDENETGDIFVRETSGGSTTLVSVNSSGAQGQFSSARPSISPDGGYVAFHTSSPLVDTDSNNVGDIYVRGIQGGQTYRASLAADGTDPDDRSSNPSISTGGKVAYFSYATNLVSGDTNGVADVFVSSMNGSGTQRVSVGSNGAQSDAWSDNAAISSDGKHVAFNSAATNLVADDTNGYVDVFVRSLTAGTTTRASLSTEGEQGNDTSYMPALSSDGQYVAFESSANTLVSGDYNGVRDIFVRDTGGQSVPSPAGVLHLLLQAD